MDLRGQVKEQEERKIRNKEKYNKKKEVDAFFSFLQTHFLIRCSKKSFQIYNQKTNQT
jgi:hypothetical protein